MPTLIFLGLIFAWMLASATVIICASMMSSRISRRKETANRLNSIKIVQMGTGRRKGQDIPTRPRKPVLERVS
jgi:hypothetical protein